MINYLKKNPLWSASKTSLEVNQVVIGVPAHFPERKRETLRRSAGLSGFQSVYFMVESTAAAMAYGLLVAGQKYVLIFDMGGGTTDLTVLHLSENGKYEVKFTAGQSRLGGNDIDAILVDHIVDNILKGEEKHLFSSFDDCFKSIVLSFYSCRIVFS
jgi:molecular chaperone DnaK (HSP70)